MYCLKNRYVILLHSPMIVGKVFFAVAHFKHVKGALFDLGIWFNVSGVNMSRGVGVGGSGPAGGIHASQCTFSSLEIR